ncbi:MAG: photosynthetic reaction center subunit L [Vulcanimicrobiaceae bacterium]
MQAFESVYRKRGGTFLADLFGRGDPFDFWVGRFYVGIFGLISVGAAALGIAFIAFSISRMGDGDLVRINIPPPLRQYGLGLAPFDHGGNWEWIVGLATVAFVAWAAREVEICKKLEMGYHVPIMFCFAISAWVTIQFIRPLLLHCWCEGFDLGFTGHLTWVSNTGFRYQNFYLNPFHAYGILGFFLTAMVLGMHGSAILGTYNTNESPAKEVANVDNFWRDYMGYSIGELGIHVLGFWLAIFALIMSDLCILTSGPFVTDWVDFWHFKSFFGI